MHFSIFQEAIRAESQDERKCKELEETFKSHKVCVTYDKKDNVHRKSHMYILLVIYLYIFIAIVSKGNTLSSKSNS